MSAHDHLGFDENPKDVPSKAAPGDLPLSYFVLVFALSIPVWLLSSLLGNKLPIPINLPISVFAFANPLIAAAILSYRRYGSHGVKELLKKTFDFRKTKRRVWYLPTLLLIPLIYLLSYVTMRLVGSLLPDPVEIPLLMAPVLFIAYFIGAACEELGWTGYAIDPMQNRWGALIASLVLGMIWQLWHIIGNLQSQHPAAWILWHGIFTIALRILMVWIYNNTGKSVFAAIVVHTTDNVSWSLFPNYGSAYDPFFTAIFACLAVVIVIIGWETKTFTCFRFKRVNR